MAGTKISDLTERASPQDTDLFVLADADEGFNYKVAYLDLLTSVFSILHSSGIAGDFSLGDLLGGNYTTIETDGTLRFVGAATTWQDIDFPIIIRTTGPNIPSLTTLQGNITVPEWEVNDLNICEGQELVHQWKEGSEFQWHVHMITNGSNTTDRWVNWEIEWCWINPNGVLSSNIITTREVLIPANTPSKTMLIREIGLVTIAGIIGGHVFAGLRRIALTTGGRTGPTNNPWCNMLQMHIECDTVGSREKTTK